ncbi:hypothetical protein AOXY_G10266 [Acipenser oxyrinchus oxyrinchus]|uniref:Uncharacterized protein n=1 Tax=Acipenser oxyrinchus oxyrinchus TaxID=40147 RepID=A0AAD8DIS5_ACIOX|nr:hypothetical protein AOXY_G10266 [Acipenser oxyrinchus oxyrinchus]
MQTFYTALKEQAKMIQCCIGGETEEQKSQSQRDAPSRILKEDLHSQDVNLHSPDHVAHPAHFYHASHSGTLTLF